MHVRLIVHVHVPCVYVALSATTRNSTENMRTNKTTTTEFNTTTSPVVPKELNVVGYVNSTPLRDL